MKRKASLIAVALALCAGLCCCSSEGEEAKAFMKASESFVEATGRQIGELKAEPANEKKWSALQKEIAGYRAEADELAKKYAKLAAETEELRDSAGGSGISAVLAAAGGAVVGAVAVAAATSGGRYPIEEEFSLLYDCIFGGNGNSCLSESAYRRLAECCKKEIEAAEKSYSSASAFRKSGESLGGKCRL